MHYNEVINKLVNDRPNETLNKGYKMKKWTKNNMHGYDIEAWNMGENQTEIAEWVENYIYDNATPSTIQEMLDNADDYIGLACGEMGWVSTPDVGGFEINIWS